MEDLYSTHHHHISCSDDHEIANFTQGPTTSTTTTTSTSTRGGRGGGGGGGGFHHHHHHHGQEVVVVEKLLHHQFQPPNHHHHHHDTTNQIRGSDARHHQISDDHLIKAQIATHPRYPKLLSAYIECRKVGAPPEMASVLEEISQEIQLNGGCCEIGADPELDEFMESYCEVLIRYKEELSKPFDEATSFLNKIEIQLSNLCKGTSTTTTTTTSGSTHHSDEVAGSSEEELSCGEVEALESQESSGQRSGDQELKEMLLRKYSGYLSSLRKEFLKKRKKGKLPKDARVTLLDWWNTHYRWPYPTEEEKMKLAEVTGLDQKQINNWFINQRKRHWKPSEDMRFALMEGVTGGGGGPPAFFDTGEGPGTDDLS